MGCGGSKSTNKEKPTSKPNADQSSKEGREEQKSAKKEDASKKETKQKESTKKKDDTGSEKQDDDRDDEGLEKFDDEAITSRYPRPKPARKDLTFPPGYFDDVDLNATTVPDTSLSSFKSLQQSLFDGADNDAKKIRAILRWYCCLNIHQMEFPPTVDDKSPRYYLKRIQDQNLSLEKFFTLFCRKIGVPCVLIRGDVKAANYEVGDADASGKMNWAAVYVNRDWRLVQAHWATSGTVGYNKGGKILVDDSTKITAEREEASAGVTISHLSEYYIFTPAYQLINVCFPEKKEWQLLKSPLSWKDFMEIPYLRPSFFNEQFGFKRKTLGVQNSKNGMCKIAIKPPDIKTTTMRSNLFFHERKSNRSWEEALDYGQKITPDRFVFKNRDLVKGEMEFEVRCPATGIYQLDLFGGKYDTAEICSFRLDCDSVMDDCKPYPQVPPIGYGPGPETFQAGLKPKSHLTGRVSARVDQSVRINFKKVVKHAHRTKQYKSDLKSDLETSVESHTWVSASADKKNYNIDVNPQKSGEYILAVSAKDTYQHERHYENICNYLIDVKESEENIKLNQIAKDNLRRALITKDVERIERALKKFEDRDMKDKEGLAENARQRIEYLRLRNGLHDAIENQNIRQLKTAISKAEESEYKDQLEPSIRNAKYELERLKNGGDNDGSRRNIPHPTPPLDARTLLEIKRYTNPNKPVCDTMKSFLLILGEKPRTLTNWKGIKKPLHEQGDDGVVKRAWNLDVRQVPNATLKDSNKILSKYDTHSIRENSVSVAAFYDWSEEVITMTEKTQTRKKKSTNKVEPSSEDD